MTLSSGPARSGMTLILAMVVMAVLTVILSVVTLQIVSQRKALQQRHRQLQAEWLARAGVELAAARLLQNPASFSEMNQTLSPDAKVRIVLEKKGKDLYLATAEAEIGSVEGSPVVRTAHAHFRRTDSDGVIHLTPDPLEKKTAD